MTHELKAGEATMGGVAARISAEEKRKAELQAQPAVLKAEITITRAATGKVEHYTITGTPEKEA